MAAGNEKYDTEAWASGLSQEYLLCRDTSVHHSWEPHNARFDKKLSKYVRVLRCSRCGTQKEQQVDMDGYTGRTRTDYADGYLRPHGAGRMKREDNATIRVESLLRTIDAGVKRRKRGA